MSDILKGLNPMQQEAVLHSEGPLLILAGAGSGKTRVLTHRIAYLIENGVRPWNILAITFTNKAAREMKERVERAAYGGSEVWVSTFHSTCVKILRREGQMLGYSPNFTIYDTADCERLIKSILKESDIDDKTYRPKSVLSAISSLKNECITPSLMREKAENFRDEVIADIYADYQKGLFRNNAFDFDDLINKTLELFRAFPEVLLKYQDRFRYILVDEYQDTNTAQYMLVNLLASRHRNLCVVGDDDQSIYSFRGANINNILSFEQDYPEARVIKLEQNYRSTSCILDAANAVISNNESRKGKTLWTDKPQGEPITFYRADTDRDEALFIADNIKRLVNRGMSYNSIAVLYRNNALSRALGEGMVKASIPYVVVRGHSFYETAEIKDMMAYLKFIYNPDSQVDLERIINVPKRGIGAATIDKISRTAVENGISSYEVIKNIETFSEFSSRSKKLTEFRSLAEELIVDSLTVPVSELVDEIYTKTGYLSELLSEGDITAQNRIENIYELKSKAADFEEQNPDDPSLAAFLDEISLVSDTDALDSEEGAVSLLTLHASKGLEFPVVFLAGFEDGIFPSSLVIFSGSSAELEEERRLLYVGITRAEERLFITCAKSRMQHGSPVFNLPSRFLEEIPRQYMRDLSFKERTYNHPVGGARAVTKPINVSGGYVVGSKPKTAATVPAKAYKPGDKVRQVKYGIGTVLEVSESSKDPLLTIEFRAGVKKLYSGMVKPVSE